MLIVNNIVNKEILHFFLCNLDIYRSKIPDNNAAIIVQKKVLNTLYARAECSCGGLLGALESPDAKIAKSNVRVCDTLCFSAGFVPDIRLEPIVARSHVCHSRLYAISSRMCKECNFSFDC